jgi:hypothetical protein
MKKVIYTICFISLALYVFIGSGTVLADSKYTVNKDRLDRIENGCQNTIRRNESKCYALQNDLVRDMGPTSCGRLITSFGINKGAIELCRNAINDLKPSSKPSSGGGSTSDSGSTSTGGTGGGSTPSSTTPDSSSANPGGESGESTPPVKWCNDDPTCKNGIKAEISKEKVDTKLVSPVTKKSETDVVGGILNAIYTLAAIIAIIVIIACGIIITTSNGDPQKVAIARSGIIYALVGLAIIGSAFVITGIIQNIGSS